MSFRHDLVSILSILLFSSPFSSSLSSTAFAFEKNAVDAKSIPKFHAQTYRLKDFFTVTLVPPALHHFNVGAPASVHIESASPERLRLVKDQVSQGRMVFKPINTPAIVSAKINASAFLCDDAKTFCVKQTILIPLNDTLQLGELPDLSKNIKKNDRPKSTNGLGNKLFIDLKEQPDAVNWAIQESLKTKKPILIDFYGIWCPPCNLYEELVFTHAKFKKMARSFILLKADADDERSFLLKSQFKIGGYPTLLFLSVNEVKQRSEKASSLSEIDRVVGFLQVNDLMARMNSVLKDSKNGLKNLKTTDATSHLNQQEELRIIYFNLLEQDEYEKAKKLVKEKIDENASHGSSRWIDELKFYQHYVSFSENETFDKDAVALIDSLLKNKKELHQSLLGAMQSVCLKFAWKDQFNLANEELMSRINPKTLFIQGSEWSLPDLYLAQMDEATHRKDQAAEKVARKQAIDAYLKMMKLNQMQQSKAIHLELAALYRLDGQFDVSQKIHDDFIKMYPKEFTFYLGASKLNQAMKKWKEAEQMAQKAIQFAYGDNLIRSVIQLAKVQFERGSRKSSIETIDDFVKKYSKDSLKLNTRSKRYYDDLIALRKRVIEAQQKGTL